MNTDVNVKDTLSEINKVRVAKVGNNDTGITASVYSSSNPRDSL